MGSQAPRCRSADVLVCRIAALPACHRGKPEALRYDKRGRHPSFALSARDCGNTFVAVKTSSLILSGALVIALCVSLSPIAIAQQKYSDTEAGKHAGNEATVTGKVASVSKSGKGTTYVNFGEKFPRQTFSGVVFAKDADKVGDLSQFEGKVVALTGRIELSPDSKPQIVIKSADQVKLADIAAPSIAATPPAPAAPRSPVPAPPALASTIPVPTSPASTVSSLASPGIAAPKPTPPPREVQSQRIALAPNWANAPQTGDLTRKDLAALFGSSIVSGENSVAEDSIIIYPEVPYLTPLAAARRNLHLENTNASRTKITTPGLPVASLTANTFPGIFPGGFTALTLVTDNSDQVVSVHLVDSNPRQRTADITNTAGYHTYNFIAQRDKSAGQLVIKHDILREGAPAGVVVVDSLLIDPNAPDPNAPPRTSAKGAKSGAAPRQPRTGKVLERSRWYVPKPIVNVILRASGNR